MKIALLNLPYDNNYGGNLQRYALMKVLTDMGHEVTYIKWCHNFRKPWYITLVYIIMRIIKNNVRCKKTTVLYEYYAHKKYLDDCKKTDVFLNRYIRHTDDIYTKNAFRYYAKGYDAYIVGSDQIWRKKYASSWLSLMFLDFVSSNEKVKRLAYAVSFGDNKKELTSREIKKLDKLYKLFDGVSIREDSASILLDEYGWTIPKPCHVLDPTLLLRLEDYNILIDAGNTTPLLGKLACYILDPTPEKESYIEQKAREMNTIPHKVYLTIGQQPSVEQWLRMFRDSEFIVTDSYHGYLFSIIYNKPCHLFLNEKRGNARFDSLNRIIDKLQEMREGSIRFIQKGLEKQG